MQQNSAFGETIIELNEIDSTNNYAMRLINEGMAEHGLTIRADFQTAGKGQHGNVWLAEESKNLLCSVILDTKEFELERQFILNCMTCVCITEMLMQQYVIPNVSIKWPNDIYAGNKKIAGILIENNIRGTQWTNAVVGIGLNINQEEFSHLNTATSMKNELGKDVKIKQVLKHLLKKMGTQLTVFKTRPEHLLETYNSYLLNINREIQYMKKYELKTGILKRVNDQGLIEIEETPSGKHIRKKSRGYKHKEIELMVG
ncbi:MAG: biotin--[acetyl-CoA-carboxylase] ligase [Chitinophagaceae bacterium]|nr:biotin--[acetyl-CoA-carboxylase] ligase [Chitinophagaceae bacterium]